MAKKLQTDDTHKGASPNTAGLEQKVREVYFRLLVDAVRDYAIVILDPQGIVLTWNPGAEAIKGYKAAEIIGKHFSRFYPPEAVERGLPQKELKVAVEQGRYEDESWRVRKDGTRFWANVVFTALRDPSGKLVGFGKLTRDLTERKKAEELLSKQAKTILEISTPVLQMWEGIVVAPLIGSMDSERTQQLMERLLQRIVETGSQVALIDITGVPTIDTRTAQHLIETITSVRLLGAQAILTGVRPAIAQTLAHLGIDMSGIVTRSSLSSGLLVALDTLNLAVRTKNPNQ
ncbi:MAG: PAS domain S-box protein [bacterium]